jgi:hypothetical protein
MGKMGLPETVVAFDGNASPAYKKQSLGQEKHDRM